MHTLLQDESDLAPYLLSKIRRHYLFWAIVGLFIIAGTIAPMPDMLFISIFSVLGIIAIVWIYTRTAFWPIPPTNALENTGATDSAITLGTWFSKNNEGAKLHSAAHKTLLSEIAHITVSVTMNALAKDRTHGPVGMLRRKSFRYLVANITIDTKAGDTYTQSGPIWVVTNKRFRDWVTKERYDFPPQFKTIIKESLKHNIPIYLK